MKDPQFPPSIVEELWWGRIIPMENINYSDPEAKQADALIARYKETLERGLTEEQRELLDRYETCMVDRLTMTQAAVFRYAFKLGARMILEMLTDVS